MTVVNGWTVLTPSSDSRLIYTSNAGNDTNAAAVYGRGYYLPSDPEIGPDPTNPIGPIVAYGSVVEASNRFRGRNWNGTDLAGGIPNYGSPLPDNSNGYPDWILFRRGESYVMPVVPTAWGDQIRGVAGLIGNWQQNQSRFSYQGGRAHGRSESERAVITAWGLPSEPRPSFDLVAVNGSSRNMAMVSIETPNNLFVDYTRDGNSADNLLMEDVKARSFGSWNTTRMQNARFRRCVVSGNFNGSAHNQGMFLSGTDTVTIEECVFDRNGYKENPDDATTWTAGVVSGQTAGALPAGTGVQPSRTYFDRNLYLSSYDSMTLRGNIISRGGGGSSVQMREGGLAERNLFIWNESALGTASRQSYPARHKGSLVKDNVVLHDDCFLPPGGWGQCITAGGADDDLAAVDGNIVAHFHRGNNGEQSLGVSGLEYYSAAQPASQLMRGIIKDNAIYREFGGVGIMVMDTVHANGITLDADVTGNAVSTSSQLSMQGNSSKPATFTYSGNRFHSTTANGLFRWGWESNGTGNWRNAPYTDGTFSQWQAAGYDTDGSFTTDFAAFKSAAGWTAPERDIVSYMQSADPTYVVNEDVYVDEESTVTQDVRQKVWEVLMNHTAWPGAMTEAQAKLTARRYHAFITFIQRAKANRKGAWDTRWTAEAVTNYIRAGFNKTSITGVYDDRALSVRLSEYLEQHGPVASLVLTTQPAGGISGNPLSSQPVVTMRDASNLTVSTDNSTQVSVVIQSGTGGTLTGTTTVTVVNGVATFTDLVLSGDPFQSYVLRFSISSPSLSIDSNNISVSSEVKVPVSIDIVTAPVGGFNDGLLTTQPVLVIKDIDNVVVSTDNTTVVTVAITGGSGGILKGTLTQTASNGIVTFTDLKLFGDESQTYTSSFNSVGLQGVTEQMALIEYPVVVAPTVSDLTAIRSDRYLGTVHSLDIMGEINKSELLSLRANKTKLVAVGHQDFIVNYRNTILRNRNTGYNIPEDWDLSWSIKSGPIATPNLIGPCFLWIKPEKFNVSTDGTKYNYLTDSSQISTFDNVFSAETDDTKALANYYGLNSFIPLNFDGVDDIYLDVEESGDFVIPTNIDFVFGFVVDTENVNTGNEGVVFSVGRENEDGSFQVIIDESSASRKVKIQTQAGDVKQSISTLNNCYTQGESIAVVVSRVENVFEISVNGVPETLSGTTMYDVIASGGGSFIGGVDDAVDDTKKKYLKHNIYEIALLKEIIDKPITTVIVDQLEGYFAAKYGVVLPSGHAYKNNPFRASVITDIEPDVLSIPEVSCSTLSATSSQTSFEAAANTGTVTVDVENESCQWSVSKTGDWITINNGAGIGDGSFTFNISENTGSQRTGTIVVSSGTASPVFISITQTAATSSVSATGGTITDVGGYRYHTFTSSGSLVVSAGGSVDLLVVGGGGGGYANVGGGGGGGGGVNTQSNYVLATGTYSVVVGAGAPGYTQSVGSRTNGESSSFDSVNAGGGDTGYDIASGLQYYGGDSGSPQSNSGGVGIAGASGYAGGGGGAGGVGDDGANLANAGDGGPGVEWPAGSGTHYGGGGGGGSNKTNENTNGIGGIGGGGDGAVRNTNGGNGTANTGGGGGGTRAAVPGAGGSGIVIVRYAV